jgi:hypothetical protein
VKYWIAVAILVIAGEAVLAAMAALWISGPTSSDSSDLTRWSQAMIAWHIVIGGVSAIVWAASEVSK